MHLKYISSSSSCCSEDCEVEHCNEQGGCVAVCPCMADTSLQVKKMREGGLSIPSQVEEGGQAELRCDPGGSCLKNGCQWTLPGNSLPQNQFLVCIYINHFKL